MLPHANPEERNAYNREYARKNRESLLERKRAYREAHREEVRSYQREYQAKRRQSKEMTEAQKIAARARTSAWYQANKERAMLTAKAHCASRRKLQDKATPAWADMRAIKAIYAQAAKLTKETGIQHEVDHIVPVRGRMVTGLHCEANLRVITKAENRSKGSALIHS